MGIIEQTNTLSLDRLRAECIPPLDKFIQPGNGKEYIITLESSTSIAAADLAACFNLIRDTSADTYRNAGVGWSPTKKQKEMKLPDMRYLLVRECRSIVWEPVEEESPSPPEESRSNTKETEVGAFLSFMFTYEDGHEVIYCYELHVLPALRGCGFGGHLMTLMEGAGRRIGVQKAMLTVFLENSSALGFYRRRR